jgi:hypothetical protein
MPWERAEMLSFLVVTFNKLQSGEHLYVVKYSLFEL